MYLNDEACGKLRPEPRHIELIDNNRAPGE